MERVTAVAEGAREPVATLSLLAKHSGKRRRSRLPPLTQADFAVFSTV